jgi:hypothetical protein
MHIILDSNIYAADYRMKGVAFQSLFEYMRRTESRLVLPRVIREEVVIDYGRRLKSEAKAFEDAWRKYRHVDLGDAVPTFRKPDGRYRMTRLRRKLMEPMDGMRPIYVPEITGTFLQEAFMRGVHRTRPANQNGEEMRDVILWLWALTYSDSANTEVAFISDDGGFWAGDAAHPDIDRDIRSKDGKVHIFRSIQEFLKHHAPAPTDVSEEWLHQHFTIQMIEREVIDRAIQVLHQTLPRGGVRALSIEEHKLKAGKLYEVSRDAQFAELQFHLVFKFVLVSASPTPFGFSGFGTGFGGGFGVGLGRALGGKMGNSSWMSSQWTKGLYKPGTNVLTGGDPEFAEAQPDPDPRDFRCDGEAQISVRIKDNETTQVSVDKLIIDRLKLWSALYQHQSTE